MRHSFTTAAACVALSAAVAFAAPGVAVDQPSFDFGTVPQGAKVEHVFAFRNRGDSPLVVERVRTSCGCTAAVVSSRTIPAGKSGELKVTFDSGNFGGAVSKNIFLETNDPRLPLLTLTLKGIVSEMIPVIPRQVNFGSMKAGASKQLTVILENRTGAPVNLLSISSANPAITGRIRKSRLNAGESTEIIVTAVAKGDDRFFSGYLTLRTDSRTRPEIRIPAYGTIAR